MDSILSLLKDTPIPTILVLSGVVFLFLALAGQIAGKLEIPPTRQKWAAAAGVIFLGAGLLLYLAPGLPRLEAAQTSPQQPIVSPLEQVDNPESNLQASLVQQETSATPIALGEGEACLEGFFTSIAAERVVKVESGKSGKELLGSHQTKQEPAGILLVDLGQPILALTYSIVEDDELFKIGAVVDGACQSLNFANGSRGGPRNVLENWDTLEVKRAGSIYTLRFSYYGGVVSLDTSQFQE